MEPPKPDKPPHGKVDDDLQARLIAYHKAIEEEFNVINAAVATGEPDAIAEAARSFLIKETAKAAETIGWLAQNATSEAARLSAAKFILEHTLGVKGIAAPTDPMEKLVGMLKGNTPEKAAARKERSLVPPPSPDLEERG